MDFIFFLSQNTTSAVSPHIFIFTALAHNFWHYIMYHVCNIFLLISCNKVLYIIWLINNLTCICITRFMYVAFLWHWKSHTKLKDKQLKSFLLWDLLQVQIESSGWPFQSSDWLIRRTTLHFWQHIYRFWGDHFLLKKRKIFS